MESNYIEEHDTNLLKRVYLFNIKKGIIRISEVKNQNASHGYPY